MAADKKIVITYVRIFQKNEDFQLLATSNLKMIFLKKN